MASAWSQGSVYLPIAAWQTRLLRLHENQGNPDSALVCDLITADILHDKFGQGLGVPSLDPNKLIPFHALSYVWGGETRTKSILCNGIPFPIYRNLHKALRTIRDLLPQGSCWYIWADAICIDQNNDREKSTQVDNMLAIYQKATTVIAWLGGASVQLNSVLRADAACQDSSLSYELDFPATFRGIWDIYTRPYFQRIWIQQEIFAAKDLRFLCGKIVFKWPKLLQDPTMLCKLPQFERYSNSVAEEGQREEGTARNGEAIEEATNLDQLRLTNLKCFERFQTGVQSDLVETLLETSSLGVTNPRDRVYGILGMTGFPAKPMPLNDWSEFVRKDNEIFLPIDYSASLTSILCAVTRTILLKGGLSVLAHLKTFTALDDPGSEEPLPSWVIDWTLSAKLLRKTDAASYHYGESRALDKAWHTWIRHATANVNLTSKGIWAPGSAPPSHEKFCFENMKDDILPTELVIRALVDRKCHTKGRSVYVRQERPGNLFRGSTTEDKVYWKLKVDVCPTDIVVYSPSAGTKGRWLLRPHGTDRFKLIAYLSNKHSTQDMYSNWKFTTDRVPQQEVQTMNYRPLFVELAPGREDPPVPKMRSEMINVLIIV